MTHPAPALKASQGDEVESGEGRLSSSGEMAANPNVSSGTCCFQLQTTAVGLRVTLKSTIDLCYHLLSGENVSERQLEELRANLDGLMDSESRECEDVFPASSTAAEAVDCIVYCVCGYLSCKLQAMFSCLTCRRSLTVSSSVAPEAAFRNSKTKEGLEHSNYELYSVLKTVEDYFPSWADDSHVFWDTIEDVTEQKLTFPCCERKFYARPKYS
ncbi:hypothetical protein HPB51_029583 [Rhipicephalus microplus]|uniref:Uncharacterized protein n=1 Tax=Rhipicephalus microplus TaxID=6941 RepID=A0A9J6CU46_RHIMP|nr:hypothetical protein HPB51_029583 [Rhipicephalus microplus]